MRLEALFPSTDFEARGFSIALRLEPQASKKMFFRACPRRLFTSFFCGPHRTALRRMPTHDLSADREQRQTPLVLQISPLSSYSFAAQASCCVPQSLCFALRRPVSCALLSRLTSAGLTTSSRPTTSFPPDVTSASVQPHVLQPALLRLDVRSRAHDKRISQADLDLPTISIRSCSDICSP